VLYLATPTAAFVTGETLVVDGGNQVWGDQWTIPRPSYFERVDSELGSPH
jgi:citronellol/citronellal dehydrogenase